MSGKKRVLFVERNLRNEKLGIMYLAAALKHRGHHADLVQADKEDLDDRIRDYKPDFVAFSIITGEHIRALQTAIQIKAQYGIPNIFGGPHCTFFPEFGNDANIDFLVCGHGEEAILKIVGGGAAPGRVIGSVAEHPDGLSFPDRSLFYQYAEFRDNPMKNIITSRACPYRCSYCFNHSYLALTRMNGDTQRWFCRRSVPNVFNEILSIREKYPLEKVLFIDDCFIQDQAWLDTFVDGYSKAIGLPWLCSLRANRLDEAMAERLFASGLIMVNYALESADPDVQQYLLNRGHIRNVDIIGAIRLFERFGVRARMQNMIGLPLKNPLEDALNTLQFNMRHKVTDSWCSIFQPYPRTALGQYCLDHGFITDDQLSACADSFFKQSLLNIPDKNELYALQKLWYFIIEGDLPLDLVQILIRGDITAPIGESLQEFRFACSRRHLYGIGADTVDESSDRTPKVPWRPPWEHHDTGTLIRVALKDARLPARFTDILSSVHFAPEDRSNLINYLYGKRIYAAPIYTVDDSSGELLNPGESIWNRGGSGSDIRKMDPEHFMHGARSIYESRN